MGARSDSGKAAQVKCCGSSRKLAIDVATTYFIVMATTIHRNINSEANRVPPWHDRVSQVLQADLERRFAVHGVTPAQFRLLAALGRGDSDTVRGLAGVLRLDGGAVTRLADRLMAKGLVARAPDPTDARSVRLSLTEAGAALVPILDAEADAHERAWFGSLSYSELRQYKLTLAKVLLLAQIKPDEVWLRRDLGSG
jgi:DNA-binding MarR family transcriptional regulator